MTNTYYEDLIRKLLGGAYPTQASGSIPVASETVVEKKPSTGMSQESMDAYKELRYDLEAAANRNISKARKSFEGVDFADVKMPQPGLAVEDYAPVSNLGLMPSITGGSKEQRSWEARDEDELWKALRRGLV